MLASSPIGADRFVFGKGGGQDTVSDLKQGKDEIDLTVIGLTSTSTSTTSQQRNVRPAG